SSLAGISPRLSGLLDRLDRLLDQLWWSVDFAWTDALLVRPWRGRVAAEDADCLIEAIDACLNAAVSGRPLPAESIGTQLHLDELFSCLSDIAEQTAVFNPPPPSRPASNQYRRLRPKKRHEAERLLAYIGESGLAGGSGDSSSSSSSLILLDVGAGVGRFGRLLSSQFPDTRTLLIDRDARLLASSDADATLCLELRPGRDCRLAVESALDRLSAGMDNSSPVLALGQHACGSLSNSLVDLFASSQRLRSLICLPCCYHKSALSAPVSAAVSRLPGLARLFASVPARRLACQERLETLLLLPLGATGRTRLQARIDASLRRAALQLAARPDADRLLRRIRPPAADGDFAAYLAALDEAAGRHDNGEVDWPTIRGRLLTVWETETRTGDLRLAELVYRLQTLLRPVLEFVLLVDLQLYLKERGVAAELLQLFSPELSPRCLAIVAKKS
ncbi:hypothetical protein BOX15_Mlig009456g1, partial [Macrostomum lignano]